MLNQQVYREVQGKHPKSPFCAGDLGDSMVGQTGRLPADNGQVGNYRRPEAGSRKPALISSDTARAFPDDFRMAGVTGQS